LRKEKIKMVNVVLHKDFVKLKKELKEFMKETNILKKEVKTLQNEIISLKNPKCPRCNSLNIKKGGIRKNGKRRKNITQRYWCKDCEYHFTPLDINFRMRNSQENIIKALKLRKQGLSLAQISEKINGVTRQTIHRWLQQYQPPTKEKEITIKQRNQYGEYERKFKIKV